MLVPPLQAGAGGGASPGFAMPMIAMEKAEDFTCGDGHLMFQHLLDRVDSVVQGSLEVDVMWPLPTGKQDEFTGRNRAMTIMIGAYRTLEIGNCWFSFHPDFSLILGRQVCSHGSPTP